MKKPGRNDPCPCGSGKKFKKCCESKMLGGRFKATQIDSKDADEMQKAKGITSLFHNLSKDIPKKTDASDPIPPLRKETEKKQETEEKVQETEEEKDPPQDT